MSDRLKLILKKVDELRKYATDLDIYEAYETADDIKTAITDLAEDVGMPKSSLTVEQLAALMTKHIREKFDGCSLDITEEVNNLTYSLARLLLSTDNAPTTIPSPEVSLPRANHLLSFDIVDEQRGERVIKLTLDRKPDMTDMSFTQAQNFLWCVIGRALKSDPSALNKLRWAGVEIDTDPGTSSPTPQDVM